MFLSSFRVRECSWLGEYPFLWPCVRNFVFKMFQNSSLSLVAQIVKRLPAMRETQVRSQGQENPLEKKMSTHCSTLAWKIPWTEEPGGLQSMGSQRVGLDWAISFPFFPPPSPAHTEVKITRQQNSVTPVDLCVPLRCLHPTTSRGFTHFHFRDGRGWIPRTLGVWWVMCATKGVKTKYISEMVKY